LSTSNIGIAIAAPSGRPLDIEAYNLGVQRLQQQGYLVHNYYDDDKKFQRFGGTDEWRLAQLNAAAADPAVQVVIALRGSYGMSRLLPSIDFQKMADSGKLFVGYSDFHRLPDAVDEADRPRQLCRADDVRRLYSY
jgi:muramoyltetrapeptide carboxypeptidase